MDILNQQVSHKKFGVGTVAEQTEDAIFVKFANVDKQFQYPSAFQKFLALHDKILQEEVLKEAKQKEQEKYVPIPFVIKYSDIFIKIMGFI